MDKPLKINVAFLLPEKVEKAVCEQSKKLSKNFKTDFTLDGSNFIPHISVYWTEFPYHALKDISEIVEKLSKGTPKIKFKFNRAEIKHDYVYLDFDKTNEVVNVHLRYLEELNKIRQGHIREKYREQRYLYTLNNDERKMIGEFGYPYAGKMYNPHITLTKFTNKEVVSMNPKIVKLDEFTCTSIGIFEMGEHGTCTKLYKKFDLLGQSAKALTPVLPIV